MGNPSINFFKENIQFRLNKKEELSSWVKKVILKEKRKSGIINYIFCNDRYLRSMNKKYLDHNYFTDIITFNNSDDPKIVSGDIYISIDRVLFNSKQYETSFDQELRRVMIHGVLHLLGYDDKLPKEKKQMRELEDYWIEKF